MCKVCFNSIKQFLTREVNKCTGEWQIEITNQRQYDPNKFGKNYYTLPFHHQYQAHCYWVWVPVMYNNCCFSTTQSVLPHLKVQRHCHWDPTQRVQPLRMWWHGLNVSTKSWWTLLFYLCIDKAFRKTDCFLQSQIYEELQNWQNGKKSKKWEKQVKSRFEKKMNTL